MIYPVVRELAADGVPVRTACRVLQVSTSGFYEWDTRPLSERDWDQADLMSAIRDRRPTAPTATVASTLSWSSANASRSVTAGWNA
jgi:hypothetical protein